MGLRALLAQSLPPTNSFVSFTYFVFFIMVCMFGFVGTNNKVGDTRRRPKEFGVFAV